MSETSLKLGSLVVPIGAGRGLTQSLSLIENGDLRRTVNGTLKDLTRPQNRKFETTIQGNDPSIMATPSLFGIWKGASLDVECIAYFLQGVSPAAASVTLIRDPVTGSVSGINAAGGTVVPSTVTGKEVTFPSNIVAVKYRPKLSMMVVSVSWDEDEYSAKSAWSIDLEEV